MARVNKEQYNTYMKEYMREYRKSKYYKMYRNEYMRKLRAKKSK